MVMRTLRTLLAAVTMITATFIFDVLPAAAQSPPAPDAQQAAADLVALISVDMVHDLAASVVAQAWPSMESQLRQTNPDIDQATLIQLQQLYVALTQNTVAQLLKGAPAIYAKNFSAQELNDMIAFYKTPTGAKSLKLMPQVTAQISTLITSSMKNLPSQVNAAFAQIIKEHSQTPNAGKVPLLLYWSAERGDNFTTATAQGQADAEAAGYVLVRTEGYVYSQQVSGTIPLVLYRSPNGNDNFTTATAQGQADAKAAGYVLVRTEGYIFPTPAPDLVPLLLYWSAQRHDNFTTATAQGEADAKAAGYVLARIEGYIFPAH
jgi:hypothetical protein